LSIRYRKAVILRRRDPTLLDPRNRTKDVTPHEIVRILLVTQLGDVIPVRSTWMV
jgi:hypothetical protein